MGPASTYTEGWQWDLSVCGFWSLRRVLEPIPCGYWGMLFYLFYWSLVLDNFTQSIKNSPDWVGSHFCPREKAEAWWYKLPCSTETIRNRAGTGHGLPGLAFTGWSLVLWSLWCHMQYMFQKPSLLFTVKYFELLLFFPCHMHRHSPQPSGEGKNHIWQRSEYADEFFL